MPEAQPPTEQVFHTKEELHCGILYNVLQMLGHVNPVFGPAAGGETAVKAMSQCFMAVPDTCDNACFVFVEMLKLGLINGAPFITPNPEHMSPQPDHDKATEIRLLSRVFSLLPIVQSGEAWGKHFDHDLMCFNSIATKLTRSMRSLFEMQLLHLILKRRTTVDCKGFGEIASLLPYKEVNRDIMRSCHVDIVTL